MMKNTKEIGKLTFLVPFILLTMMFSGCASLPNDVFTRGIVAWNYESPIRPIEHDIQKVPVSIRVADLETNPPKRDLGFPGAILRLVPIVSIFAPPLTHTNKMYAGMDKQDLRRGEIEKILVKEIHKSGIVTKIEHGGRIKDYEIRGKVNFCLKQYQHGSGLGFIYYLALLPPLALPCYSNHQICEAHFDLVSVDGTVLLSKDYTAKTKYQLGLFYNFNRQWHAYGDELFPEIVEQFIADLKAIPQSAWIK